MKWSPYSKYKPSGIEWLGEIPEHWEIYRLKNVAHFAYGDSLTAEERILGDYDVYGSNGIVGQHNVPNTKGPCLIVGRKGSFGKIVYSEKPCFAIDTTYFIDTRFTKNNLRWLYYCLQWLRLDSFTKDSAVPGLGREEAYENVLPYCSISEQRAIAAFLDRETGRIDKLIEKKERQIELLQEKRAALISHAVTKGLNPNVKMKPSGIEWLGEIPEHWEIKRLRYIGRAIMGLTYQPSDIVDETEGTLVLRASNIQNGRISLHDNVYVKTKIPEKLITRIGDILICSRSGSRALIGKSAKITESTAGHTFGAFMLIFRSNFSDYLYYIFNSHLFEYQSGAFLTTTINQLTVDNLYSFEVPFPSIDEQIAITHYLDQETARIDTLIEKISKSIDLLREYRTALITAAVTGKIDVRKKVN